MGRTLDLSGSDLVVESISTGSTATGGAGTAVSGVSTAAQTFTGVKTFSDSIKIKQGVTDVHDTVPTAASLTSAFGSPATLGRGFIATIDDADGDTNGYVVFTSDASWYFLKFTKAS
jgi:hypothetical protein